MFNLLLGQSRQKAIAVVKLWQNQTDSNPAFSFAGDVWTDFTQRSYVGKKQVLTMAETCCSMESSASKVAARVFTTLENGMDASPTDRQSTGTVSLLDDGPQRSTSVFCSLSFNLFFVIHIFIWRQQDSKFLKALGADSGSVGRHEYSSESSGKKW